MTISPHAPETLGAYQALIAQLAFFADSELTLLEALLKAIPETVPRRLPVVVALVCTIGYLRGRVMALVYGEAEKDEVLHDVRERHEALEARLAKLVNTVRED